jgi:hypothetical protein
LLLGALVGAVLVNLLYGYRLESAHSTIKDLRAQLSYAENKLKQLQDKEAPPRELVVENIKPVLNYDGHKIGIIITGRIHCGCGRASYRDVPPKALTWNWWSVSLTAGFSPSAPTAAN